MNDPLVVERRPVLSRSVSTIRVQAKIDVAGLAAGDTADVDDSGDAAYFLAVGWLERVDWNAIPLEELTAAIVETPYVFDEKALNFAGLDRLVAQVHEQASVV